MSINFPLSESLRKLKPYEPGRPIEEVERQYGLKRVIKLASNENPLGPSPYAREAVAKVVGEMHRYPDGSAFRLRQKLSGVWGVTGKQLVFGNGSNEVIDMLVRTFCQPGDAILQPQYSFIAYAIAAQVHGARVVDAKVREDLSVDVDVLLEALNEDPEIRIVFLANPNNPTGAEVSEPDIERLVTAVESRATPTLLVLDTAYDEYLSDAKDPVGKRWLDRSANVVVLKTFSKIYGLAALRVGYGVGHEQVIQSVERARQPFNVNALALEGALAALEDHKFVARARTENAEGLQMWGAFLDRIDIRYAPSRANFILADLSSRGVDGRRFFEAAMQKGLILRPVGGYGLPASVRISVGTRAENEAAFEIFEAVLKSFS